MAVGTALHYAGSALLFISMVLTIVVDISAPVTTTISFIDLDLPGDRNAQLGVFGYCTTGGASRESRCSDASIGYNPARVLEGVDDVDFSNARADTARALTHVFVLHPVATGVLFIAFLLSLLKRSTILSIVATLAAAVGFLVSLVVVVIEFVTIALLKNEVEKGSGRASYGAGLYVGVVGAGVALIATVLMFVTCCSGRRSRRHRESRKSLQY